MGIENFTKPAPGIPDSHTSIVEKALKLAEDGNFSEVLTDAFTSAVQAIRGQDEGYYVLKIKARMKKLKAVPITSTDLDKLTEPPRKPKQRYTDQTETDGEGEQHRKGKTELLIDLIRSQAEVFSDTSSKYYASFDVELTDSETGEVMPVHRETWALDSRQFKAKMGKEFLRRFGTVAGESAMKEALEILAADADEARNKQAVYLRYAPIPDSGGVYVDLCNDQWEVVEVTPDGWCIIPAVSCKVRFRRSQNSMPLPTPETGGNIADLWNHINIQGEDSRLLVLAWLLDAMRVDTAYTLLELIAGQGSAKSTTQERLRAVIDPNAVMLRIEPRSNQDLSVSTINNHVISLNNLSHISNGTQDFMCSMSTGGGDASRKLYTNEDEAAWDTKRPVIMNGINQLVTRPDLADRTVCIELARIAYVDDSTLKTAWDKDYPKLTGALYSLLSATLRELPAVFALGNQPFENVRMGNYAKLGVAMARALRMDADFIAVYTRNRDEVVRRGVDSSPVALALVQYIRIKGTFEGTTGELMELLEHPDYKPKHFDKTAWPKAPRGLGEALRRYAPALLVYGVEVEAPVRDEKGEPVRNKAGILYRARKIDRKTDTVVTEL